MSLIRQIYVVLLLNFKSVRLRFWQSMVIVVGVSCVVGVLLSMLSMVEGMQRAYSNGDDPQYAIVVSRGAGREISSMIPREQARIITSAEGIEKAGDRTPVADSE